MVFVYRASRQTDKANNFAPAPFAFAGIYGALLERADWAFSGRSETSRRTITASVKKSGVLKMKANWIYEDKTIAAKVVAESVAPAEELPGLELI